MKTKSPLPVIIATATLLLSAMSAVSQIATPIIAERISVMARPSADSIVLRWAPLDFHVWKSANSQGYRIERYVIVRNGHVLPHPEKVILRHSIKPLPEAYWEGLVKRERYAAIAAQALYGDRFEINLTQSDIFTIVDKVRENDQRFAFALFSADMSPAVARASGLWYTDTEVKAGEKYLYRVVINSMDSLRGNVFLSPEDPYRLPEPQNLKADFKEKFVSLRWDKNKNAHYTAYTLERSMDGQHFSRLSDSPLVTVSPTETAETRYEYAIDSLQDLSKVHSYRVKGITPFGEESPPSNIASGKGSPGVNKVPYISAVDNKQNISLVVHWDFPAESNDAILGFNVVRSPKPGGAFVALTPKLLDPQTRTYEDKNPQRVNYYRITAMGLDDEAYSSHVYFAQVIDSVPPLSPAGLQGKIDSNGTVTLSWARNQETDMYGYRVYKAYHKSEELAQITSAPIVENGFTDHVDLNTLNEKVYYRVMAIDQSQNHSALSSLLALALPDQVRPQPPVLLPLESSATGVVLRWIPGSSGDITHYAVYRKTGDAQQWNRIALMRAEQDSLFNYTDEETAAGQTTLYTVISIDDAGLESEPCPAASASRINNAFRPAIAWKNPVVLRDESKISLRWNYDQPDVLSFRIFRAVDHRPPVLFKTLNGDKKDFTDTMMPGRYYVYRIMALFGNGTTSSLSDELQYQY